ncbi:MAG: hypothetical protein EB830_03650 [Nitrosopumilus sp. H13]|nr:MAG: hypothetical protein EB830_03650 [Nitrosopumilus sp. H13]
MNDLDRIEKDLISEIGLEPMQAKIYILINTRGMMSVLEVAENAGIAATDAEKVATGLVGMGALIEISGKFEAMHPRFTAVNMYRRMCEQKGIEFKQNKTVDNIGVVLEQPYDDARTGGSNRTDPNT